MFQVFNVIEHADDEGAEAAFEGIVLLVFAIEGHVALALLADDAVDDHGHCGFDGLLVRVAYDLVLVLLVAGDGFGDVDQFLLLAGRGGFPAAELKLFYYRSLKEWGHVNGYLTDTCLTAQDYYKKILDYFKIRY